MRCALVLAAFASGCSPAPAPVPAMAELDIKKMPEAGAPVAPKAAPEKAILTGGKCGEAAEGQTAPPLSPGIPVGQVTIVVFWATWAHPAIQELEKLQALYIRHHGAVEVIAMSVDDEKKGVAGFAKQHGVSYTVAWDADHAAAQCWKVQTMPSTYIVDREGVVRHLHSGYHDGEVDVIEREIAAL